MGTTMFLIFAFAGTQVANIGSTENEVQTTTNASTGFSPIVLLYIALSFGFSLMTNVWIFFRISGGLSVSTSFGITFSQRLTIFQLQPRSHAFNGHGESHQRIKRSPPGRFPTRGRHLCILCRLSAVPNDVQRKNDAFGGYICSPRCLCKFCCAPNTAVASADSFRRSKQS